MKINIPCLCGQVLNVDSVDGGQQIPCPSCGRPHTVPALFDLDTPTKANRSWIPIVGSTVGMLLLFATLAWALMAGSGLGGGGSGSGIGLHGDGSGDSGTDPYANRLKGGVGTGDEGGPGGGTGGEGLGKSNEGDGEGAGDGEGDGDGDGAGDGTGDGDGDGKGDGEPGPDVAPKSPTSQPVTDPGPVAPVPDPTALANLDDVVVEPPKPAPRLAPKLVPKRSPKPGSTPAAGTKRGTGGPYGQRGNPSLAKKMGASAESEKAVEDGLMWLARVQCKDGHWTAQGREGGRGGHTVGYTGLATLAFLGAGHTHKNKSKYSDNVRRALSWLVLTQRANTKAGLGGACSTNFYEQGIAATALCEAYGMTRDSQLRTPCVNAIMFIVSKMGANGGFGYSGAGNDAHVTSFQVMALKSAKLAKLGVKQAAFVRLKGYYDAALNKDYTTGYGIGGGRASPTGARTALGLFCRLFLGVSRKSARVQGVAKLLDKTGPQIGNIFQTYYGTYGMFQMGGRAWKKWNEAFRNPVIALQTKDGEDKGCWPNAGHAGGRVPGTAIRIMSLEVYYRYLPVNK